MSSLESERSRWFAEQVQPHEPELRAYLRHRFPHTGEVDDLVQESYLRLLRTPNPGRIESAKAYLFATARNLALALCRRPRIFSSEPVTDYAVSRILEEGADAAELLCTKQEIALLLDAIDNLPRRCREIFILRKLRGWRNVRAKWAERNT